ncbi:outer membrane beta-barrel protein [Leptospira neocaledonica]|uniref:Porin n=1 Tax=Leptospira neocaledonica TaxID=2023192 RepID=A0A2M9ZVS4_9LEPT|nr:outer membrane beta-barrel protein [Leptospira neocaledonica]PJZ76162.1 hypothetical protein CH365_15160 [Leptospira neocaledonica]
MRKKTVNLIATFTLVTASSVFAQPKKDTPDPKAAPAAAVKAEPVEKKWYDAVDFSGFVDVYYMYNNNPLQGNDIDSTRAFETNNKNFAVNAAALAVQKTAEKGSPWGFRVDFQNGLNNPYQEGLYSTVNGVYNYNLLKQAYISMYFPVLKGMTLDIGKMATHIGYEVIESMGNPNYSIGAIFQNTIPFIHTGARLTTQFTDKWAGTFYLYNSGGGTGYLSPTEANLTTSGKNTFVEGATQHKAVGTQLKGQIIEDKLSITWNTLYSQDGSQGVINPWEGYYLTSVGEGANIANYAPRAKYNKDYWFMNHAIISITPHERITIDLDYTWSEKAGGFAVNNAVAGNKEAAAANADGSDPYTIEKILGGAVNTSNTKASYKAYGSWIKVKINEEWGVNFRFEYIDDSKYNTQLTTFNPFRNANAYLSQSQQQEDAALAAAVKASTPALAGLSDNEVLQILKPKDYTNYGATHYGSYKTFTVTPVWNFTENLLIKLDMRRDWANGYQFVNSSGEKSKDQYGLTLGIVAKF